MYLIPPIPPPVYQITTQSLADPTETTWINGVPSGTVPLPDPTRRPISREMITTPPLRIRNPGEDKRIRKRQAKAKRPAWRQ